MAQDTHELSDFVAGMQDIEDGVEAAEAEAAGKSTVAGELGNSNPYSLVTNDGEQVLVVAKGSALINKGDVRVTIELKYDGVTVDQLADLGDPSEHVGIAFCLVHYMSPGAATADLEVTVTGGSTTVSDILFLITRIT